MNIAIIPARGGSQRIKGKNFRLFHGKPIIAYSIETARASGRFDKIIVSTDSPMISEVAKAYGARIHNRAAKLCENDVGTQEVAAACLRWWMSSPNTMPPEFVCVIYATAPLMQKHDLQAGLEMLRNGTMKYVYSVDHDDKDVGQWYWGRPKSFLDGVPLSDANCTRLYIPPDRCCDINVEDDWLRAERMYRELKCGHKYELVVPNPEVPEMTHLRCKYCDRIPQT